MDKSGADGVGDNGEHNWNGIGGLQQRRNGPAGMGQDNVGAGRNQFRCVIAHFVDIATAPAVIDPNVLATDPA